VIPASPPSELALQRFGHFNRGDHPQRTALGNVASVDISLINTLDPDRDHPLLNGRIDGATRPSQH